MREAFTASKLWIIGEAAADKLSSGLADEHQCPRVAALIILALYRHWAGFALGGRTVEFFGGRHAGVVFETVFVAKQAEVDGAVVHLVEIERWRAWRPPAR